VPYDVGAKVAELHALYLGTEPNRATPANMAVLLESLRKLTRTIGVETLRFGWIRDADEQRATRDLLAWEERLDAYEDAVDDAKPGDRTEIQWSVTAPLLLGLYGGPESQEQQRTADVATPFIVANQVALTQEVQDELWADFVGDLEKRATRTGMGLGVAVLIALGLFLAVKVS
jgi:hypothetical protein